MCDDRIRTHMCAHTWKPPRSRTYPTRSVLSSDSNNRTERQKNQGGRKRVDWFYREVACVIRLRYPHISTHTYQVHTHTHTLECSFHARLAKVYFRVLLACDASNLPPLTFVLPMPNAVRFIYGPVRQCVLEWNICVCVCVDEIVMCSIPVRSTNM